MKHCRWNLNRFCCSTHSITVLQVITNSKHMPETGTFYSSIIFLPKVNGSKQTLLDANINSQYRTVLWVDWNNSCYLNKKTINVNFSSKKYQKHFNKPEILKAFRQYLGSLQLYRAGPLIGATLQLMKTNTSTHACAEESVDGTELTH